MSLIQVVIGGGFSAITLQSRLATKSPTNERLIVVIMVAITGVASF
jgi:NADH dehydrogenase FAD-containing subunit